MTPASQNSFLCQPHTDTTPMHLKDMVDWVEMRGAACILLSCLASQHATCGRVYICVCVLIVRYIVPAVKKHSLKATTLITKRPCQYQHGTRKPAGESHWAVDITLSSGHHHFNLLLQWEHQQPFRQNPQLVYAWNLVKPAAFRRHES